MIGKGIRMPNSAGLVTVTGGGAGFEDILHNTSVGRKAIIRKILWYNPLAVNVLMLIGTISNVPGFVQLLTTLVAIPVLNGGVGEEDLPEVIFAVDTTAAGGSDGSIWLQDAGAGGLLIRLEIEEF